MLQFRRELPAETVVAIPLEKRNTGEGCSSLPPISYKCREHGEASSVGEGNTNAAPIADLIALADSSTELPASASSVRCSNPILFA